MENIKKHKTAVSETTNDPPVCPIISNQLEKIFAQAIISFKYISILSTTSNENTKRSWFYLIWCPIDIYLCSSVCDENEIQTNIQKLEMNYYYYAQRMYSLPLKTIYINSLKVLRRDPLGSSNCWDIYGWVEKKTTSKNNWIHDSMETICQWYYS